MNLSLCGGVFMFRKRRDDMELNPRQVAFVKSEMERVEETKSRRPTEKVEAARIRKEAESTLTE